MKNLSTGNIGGTSVKTAGLTSAGIKKAAVAFAACLLTAALSISTVSCNYGLNEAFGRKNMVYERAVNMTELRDEATQNLTDFLSDKKKYTILIISDLHFGRDAHKRRKTHAEAEDSLCEWIERQKADDKLTDFCICLGDIADHGKEAEYEGYVNLVQRIKATGIRNVYTVVGNHDLYNSGWRHYSTKIYPL